MPNYIVTTTAQASGAHEVHDENSMCHYLPEPGNRRSLGWFSSSQSAVDEAKKTFSNAKGCTHCASA